MSCRKVLLAGVVLLLGAGNALAQTRIITGRVTDSLTNEALTTGQVTVQGTAIAATIKDDGTFTIVAPQRDVLVMIRSIGFKRRDIAVPTSQNSVEATLARDYFQLEAIVVTGQATGVERRNLANAVASVNAEQLVRTAASSVEQSLQGKVAGAYITQNNGAPGGGNIVRMRGVTSIIGSFQPLYVVDGVIVSNAEIGRGTNMLVRAYTSQGIVPTVDNQDNAINRIADLNPNDIENVEVLKGAAASAIYGSKASNGVVLITTKRGRFGTPQFSVMQRVGAAKISNMYGSRCYATAAEAFGVFGDTTGYQAGTCHDFEKELYGRAAYAYETSANVSGGSENTRYFSSILVKHDGGIMPGTYADKQGIRLNLDQSIGNKLQVSVGADILHDENDRGLSNNENNGAPPQAALSSMPTWRDYRGICPDSTRVTNPGKPCAGVVYPYTSPYAFSNPFQTVALVENRETVWRSIFTGRVNWDVAKGGQHSLRVTANGGGDVFYQKNHVYSPPEVQFEQTRGVPGTSATGVGESQSFNVNGNLIYAFKTGGSSATTQLGLQFESAQLDRINTLANNLVGGQFNVQNGTVLAAQQYRERIRDVGFFAQEEFLTLGDRLLLTAGVRGDKSSNNSDPAQWYYYPKAATSYRVPLGGVFSEFKVRAAMGQSGNRPTYGQKFTNLTAGNINGVPTSTVSSTTAAADLRPERQTELEGGLDATMFKGRANLELTVYQKDIKDLLLTRTLTPTTGFTQLVYNGVFTDSTGATQTTQMRNRGLEVGLTVLPVQTRDFQWRVQGTYSANGCTVLSVPATFQPIAFFNFPQFGTTRIEKDSSCTQVWANDTIGRLPGDAAFICPASGTTQAIGSVCRRKIGDNSPAWRGGVSSELSFKGLKLYVLFDHQQGGLITNFSRYTYDAVGTSADEVVAQPGELTGQQRLAQADLKTALGSATWDASYTKLREATLTFELPTAAVKRIWSGARFVRLSASGRNLLTWSHYSKIGYDPEVQQVARSLAASMTWELWAYPASRNFYFTVDVGF